MTNHSLCIWFLIYNQKDYVYIKRWSILSASRPMWHNMQNVAVLSAAVPLNLRLLLLAIEEVFLYCFKWFLFESVIGAISG